MAKRRQPQDDEPAPAQTQRLSDILWPNISNMLLRMAHEDSLRGSLTRIGGGIGMMFRGLSKMRGSQAEEEGSAGGVAAGLGLTRRTKSIRESLPDISGQLEAFGDALEEGSRRSAASLEQLAQSAQNSAGMLAKLSMRDAGFTQTADTGRKPEGIDLSAFTGAEDKAQEQQAQGEVELRGGGATFKTLGAAAGTVTKHLDTLVAVVPILKDCRTLLTKILNEEEFFSTAEPATEEGTDVPTGMPRSGEIGRGAAKAGLGAAEMAAAAAIPQGGPVSAALFAKGLKDLGEGMAIIAIELVQVPGRLQQFGAALIENTRRLSEYNGTIAMAILELSIGRLRRDIAMGDLTARSTQGLSRSQNRLEDALLPFQAAVANVKNTLTEFANDATSSILEGVQKLGVVAGLLEWINKKMDGDQAGPPLNELLIELAEAGGMRGRKIPPMPEKKNKK